MYDRKKEIAGMKTTFNSWVHSMTVNDRRIFLITSGSIIV